MGGLARAWPLRDSAKVGRQAGRGANVLETIDESRLEEDVYYRFRFVARFIDFEVDDLRALREIAPRLIERLEPIIEEIYERFRAFDATWRHFSVPSTGCPMASASQRRHMEEIATDHGSVLFRRHKLLKYFRFVLLRPFDDLTVRHFDQMARRHRGASESAAMRIPLVQMNAFMAFLADRVTVALLELELGREQERAALRAVQKLLWLQTDLITRHYQVPAQVKGSSHSAGSERLARPRGLRYASP